MKALREKNSKDKQLQKIAKDKALAELAKTPMVIKEVDEKKEAQIFTMKQSAQNISNQLNPAHKKLLAAMFEKPTPHYTISYDSLKNFIITAMGGKIESPGGGGSHRKITLHSSMAYFDMFEDSNEIKDFKAATNSVTSIVQAHKNGVPRGMLSRVDINNIRDLLERLYITPNLENTASAEIQGEPQAKCKRIINTP